MTLILAEIEPLLPILITSPTWLSEVGSPTRHQVIFSSFCSRYSTTLQTPSTAGPSSSLVSRRPILPVKEGLSPRNSSIEVTKAATLLFISAVPLPTIKGPFSVAVKGSLSHSSIGPVGTTSVWPRKTKRGPESPKVAQRLSTSPYLRCSIEKPILLSLSAISF